MTDRGSIDHDALEDTKAPDSVDVAAEAEGHGDWAWRQRLRANPHSHRVYRTMVGVAGALVVGLGLVLVPFPGPGWLIVFLGVAIWASEFSWAQRLLRWGRARLSDWNDWLMSKSIWVRLLVGFATLLLVWALFYTYFAIAGVPSYLPDFGEDWLNQLPALDPAAG
jgi:uncharacterized protein (TIGR02611 family)